MRNGRLGYEMLARSSELLVSFARLRGWEVSRWRCCWMTRVSYSCSAQGVTKLVCGGVFAAAAPPCVPHPMLALPPAFPGVDVSVLGKRQAPAKEASEVQASSWSVLRCHVSFADNSMPMTKYSFLAAFGLLRRR